jgi:LDH2 family malate/lactate/ureidoglycolate dehydrogenase
MKVVVDGGPVCRLDAHHALGPAAAARGMTLAIERGRSHGISLVAVGRSTHFGPAGYYARRAAEQGLIGIAITNAPATMAPFGATQRFLGTNPIAIACSVGRHGVFSLDMSSSVVARGKIIRAALLGEPVAPGLALDPSGAPTTDPDTALTGSVLPLGGPKGSNLALAITMLCAVLAGSECDDEMASMYEDPDRRQSVGHVFITVDPTRFESADQSIRRLEGLVDRLHALRRADEAVDVLFAGELEERCAAHRRASGIPVPAAEMNAFAEGCTTAGLEGLASQARALVAAAGGGEL